MRLLTLGLIEKNLVEIQSSLCLVDLPFIRDTRLISTLASLNREFATLLDDKTVLGLLVLSLFRLLARVVALLGMLLSLYVRSFLFVVTENGTRVR